MVVTEVVVDVGGRDLAGVDGADDGGRSGLAVAAAVEALEAGNGAVGLGNDAAPLAGDAHGLERRGDDVLADGNVNALARDDALGILGGARRRAATAGLPDDLGLDAQAAGAAVGADLDGDGGRELEDLAALGLSAGDLGVLCGHVADAAAVDDGDLICSEADRRAGDVHGDVAAADDHDALAGEVGHLLVADGAQHLYRGLDAGGVLVGQAELLVGVCANGKVDGVVVLAQAGELLAVDGVLELDLDAALEDPVDLLLEALTRQAVAGDTVAEHAAKVTALLKDRDVMAHDREVVGARDAGGAAADNGDALVSQGGDPGAVVLLHVLGREALEREDVHGVVDHAATAVHLAGVLADEAADAR